MYIYISIIQSAQKPRSRYLCTITHPHDILQTNANVQSQYRFKRLPRRPRGNRLASASHISVMNTPHRRSAAFHSDNRASYISRRAPASETAFASIQFREPAQSCPSLNARRCRKPHCPHYYTPRPQLLRPTTPASSSRLVLRERSYSKKKKSGRKVNSRKPHLHQEKKNKGKHLRTGKTN